MIIGCGTIDFKRHSSSYLITAGDRRLLFDIGRGTIDNLMKAHIDPYAIDAIFLTHFHSDHTIELVPFITAVIHNPEHRKLKSKYTIYGPSDTKMRIMRFLSVFDIDEEKFDRSFKIIELKPNTTFSIDGIIIKNYSNVHHQTIKSISYRISYNNKTIFYSGDSEKCSGIFTGCKDANIALLECTSKSRRGHLDGIDAGEIAQSSKVEKLIITHIGTDYPDDIRKEIRKSYHGKIIIAKEFMKIKV
jgi:ribonuclease BN (tRNA processing enzyme)